MRSLRVSVHQKVVGSLDCENRQYGFQYQVDADEFVSLTMPVRRKRYESDHLLPIFSMNLPEGYLLSVIQRHFSKLVSTDEFGLLELMAPNLKSRLSYGGHREDDGESLALQDLRSPSSDRLFNDLVTRFALTSPISGVQPKVIAQIKDKATLAVDEFIVKSWGDDYPELALNEFVCMTAVANAGLPVPEFFLSDDRRMFVMRRFDRVATDQYLGFEDLCVLQAKHSVDKYTGSYEKAAKTIQQFVVPRNQAMAMRQFFQMIVMNTLLRNGDAHLKNFGVVYATPENVGLAPVYDVVSTTAYLPNDVPALTMAGSKRWWSFDGLIRFGQSACGLSLGNATQLYAQCVDGLKQTVPVIQTLRTPELSDDAILVLDHLAGLIDRAA